MHGHKHCPVVVRLRQQFESLKFSQHSPSFTYYLLSFYITHSHLISYSLTPSSLLPAITDETLSFVARSRRLLVVVSPGYASRGSQALLELKAGLDSMARGGHLRVILVQYRPVRGQGWVKELRRARMALALVHWRGDQSQQLTSRFWKKLRVELPLRERSSQKEAGLMRLLHPDGASYQRKATLPGGLR